MPTPEAVTAALIPLAQAVADLDLTDAAAAERELSRAFPPEALGAIRDHLFAAADEGWLVPRQATPTLRFGRLAKPTPATFGLSIDVVDMSGEGAEHTHPNGEVSLCFAREGAPAFDGSAPGWVVKAPGSHHTPTVTGGRMLIAYFLPGGAMTWGPEA